jgi:hypothetical protein
VESREIRSDRQRWRIIDSRSIASLILFGDVRVAPISSSTGAKVAKQSVMVGRRNGSVVAYVLGTSLAAQAHIPIVRAMLRAFPPPPDCYLYGPVCVAENERRNGLAGAMFKILQTHMTGRSAMTFVQADNEPSLRAHRKMGMRELGSFLNSNERYIAFRYSPE